MPLYTKKPYRKLWANTKMSILTKPLYNLLKENLIWGIGSQWRQCQHWTAAYFPFPLCRWHWCKCWRGRSWRPGRSWQDKSQGKQPNWLPKGDQDQRSEARGNGKLQVPWLDHTTPGFFPELLKQSDIIRTWRAYGQTRKSRMMF